MPRRLDITVVPANQATWNDLSCVFDAVKCHGSRCYCQRYKIRATEWKSIDPEERAHRLRAQTDCDHPEADSSTGVVAYADGEAVGWCAVDQKRPLATSRT